uniref:Antitoxin Xre/MbcA/ParS-like toxin-binding domain-containing protein n=1 Tax=Pseudomonas sp. LM8 TaxID=545908 RepID=A0A097H0V3_9PSED|nr:antitoxin Xre/MbcA/ParS toxin-binding domain-containing protein [Pseudomonas sp. LM8]AIT41788.1 hypothetical protein [Pseudomonas sp. LM8]
MYAKAFVDDYQPRLAGLLGLPDSATDLDVHTYIMQGIPLDHVATLQKQVPIDFHAIGCFSLFVRLGCKLVSSTALPGQRLSADEGDRLLRVLHVLVVVESLFGDRDKALRWLSTPKRRFGGSSPIEMLNTHIGAGLVEELLVQLADGLVF